MEEKLKKIGEIVGIDFLHEPYITLIGAVVLLGLIVWFIRFTIKTVHEGKIFIANPWNLVFLFLFGAFLVIGFRYIKLWKSPNKSAQIANNITQLKILEFKSNKLIYSVNDKIISFLIKSNKDAYYYLHTQKAHTTQMIPLAVGDNNSIKANRTKETWNFSVKEYVGDERVILTLTTEPYSAFAKKIEKKSYTKQLEAVGSNSEYLDEHSAKAETATREIKVKIKKDKTLHQMATNTLPRIIINTESNEYGLGESINFAIEASKEGYVTVFEVVSMRNIVRKKSAYTQNMKLRSFTTASVPRGEHIAIAIYTKKNEHITANDFNIEQIETKGGMEYLLHFKNGKKYATDYVAYNIFE